MSKRSSFNQNDKQAASSHEAPHDYARPEHNETGGGWSTDGLAYLTKQIERQRVYVVHPYLKDALAAATSNGALVRSPDARLAEAIGLAEAINIDLVGGEAMALRGIRPATYLGTGKLDDLSQLVKDEEIDLIVFDCELSPIQQRNLERALKAKVIDRTALILEIFGDRASTKEGELQVELAHLIYQRSRLVRSWTHLERQRGGAGFMGGPGETQIEADRRIIADRISRIKNQLKEVTRTRTLHRARRQKAPYPIVALVGYTNAGKSTLFNRLTKAEVLAEDMLFATLDPTMRALSLPSGRKIILSDTVGFISELPTTLVAAFRATLEEVLEADVILHVRDAAHPDTDIQRYDVEQVLGELGVNLKKHLEAAPAHLEDAQKSTGYDPRGTDPKAQTVEDESITPIIEVMNKTDSLPEARFIELGNIAARHDDVVPVSGLTGQGCNTLIARLDALLGAEDEEVELLVPFSDGATPAWLHANAKILACDTQENGVQYRFRVDPVTWGKFSKKR